MRWLPRRIRTSLRNTAVCLAVVFVAGCGGDGGAETPLLPRDVAESLASRSDAVATALDAGDSCGAAGEAEQLRAQAIQAVNAGRIPERYHEDLLTSANGLAASTAEECSGQAPPPPTTETDETTAETETETDETEEDGDEGDDGKGKGKDKGKDKGEDDDEVIPSVSLTVPTMPADVQGRRSEKKEKKHRRQDDE